MTRTTPAPSKELTQALKKVENARAPLVDLLKNTTSRRELHVEYSKRLVELDAMVEAAKAKGAKGVRDLAAIPKAMTAAMTKLQLAVIDAINADVRAEATAKVRGLLAEAMLLVAKIATPSIGKRFIAEQVALRAKADKLEQLKNNELAGDGMSDLADVVVAFNQRAKTANELSAWLQGTYKPMVLKTEAAIAAVPQERVRRVLAVEIDFIEADGRPFVAKADLGGLKGATVSRLQALDRQAARMKAVWTSLDREMVRVGGLIKDAGAPKDLAGWLAALAKEKAAGWPKAGTAELLDKTVDAFEKDLAELAHTAKRGVAQAAGR